MHATTNPAASAIVRFDGMCHDIYSEKDLLLMKKSNVIDWIIRLVKGAFVGTGFILPGVSGGALAAIFGLYEKIITFIAHITKDFKENFFFFLPVGIGMLVSIILLAHPLSYFLENHLAPTMWFFVGAIAGIIPSLWKQAGREGRSSRHYVIAVFAFILAFLFLKFGVQALGGDVPQNFGTWVMAGALIALGVLLPGLSPSNLLLYMGMYAAMVDAFKSLDMVILIPLVLGLLACLLIFSKLVDKLFEKTYAGLYHVIMGVVLASTVLIIPLDFNYLSLGGLLCLGTCLAGTALGWWMSRLEDQYKPSEDE